MASLDCSRKLGSGADERLGAWPRGAAIRGASCVKHRRPKEEGRAADKSSRRNDCAIGAWVSRSSSIIRDLEMVYFFILGYLNPD